MNKNWKRYEEMIQKELGHLFGTNSTESPCPICGGFPQCYRAMEGHAWYVCCSICGWHNQVHIEVGYEAAYSHWEDMVNEYSKND